EPAWKAGGGQRPGPTVFEDLSQNGAVGVREPRRLEGEGVLQVLVSLESAHGDVLQKDVGGVHGGPVGEDASPAMNAIAGRSSSAEAARSRKNERTLASSVTLRARANSS